MQIKELTIELKNLGLKNPPLLKEEEHLNKRIIENLQKIKYNEG